MASDFSQMNGACYYVPAENEGKSRMHSDTGNDYDLKPQDKL